MKSDHRRSAPLIIMSRFLLNLRDLGRKQTSEDVSNFSALGFRVPESLLGDPGASRLDEDNTRGPEFVGNLGAPLDDFRVLDEAPFPDDASGAASEDTAVPYTREDGVEGFVVADEVKDMTVSEVRRACYCHCPQVPCKTKLI